MQKLMVEFGMGTSLRRGDYTQAATRAVQDALWHNSINLAELFGFDKADMRITLDVGVAKPEEVDAEALRAVFPYGEVTVNVTKGGLDVPRPEGTGNPTIMANVALSVGFDMEKTHMTEQRIIIEMGMGNDLHGMDYTKAAKRAIEDAFRHSSLPLFGVLELPHDAMRVQVTVGVQEPDALDLDALRATLPRGRAEVTAVHGGLNVASNGETIVIAQASVEAFLPPQTDWKLKG